DEMGGNSDVVQMLEDVFRDSIVENALAFDHVVLLRVEGGRVVLEVLDQSSRFRSFVEDLALAFIDSATAAHRRVPWFVHLDAVAPVEALDPRQRRGGSTRRERATRPRRKASRSGATAQSRWNGFVAQGLRISPVALTIASRYARARGDFHACGGNLKRRSSPFADGEIDASAAVAEKRGGNDDIRQARGRFREAIRARPGAAIQGVGAAQQAARFVGCAKARTLRCRSRGLCEGGRGCRFGGAGRGRRIP